MVLVNSSVEMLNASSGLARISDARAMHADVEWRSNGSGILRAGANFRGFAYGDPYDFFCLVERNRETAFLIGATFIPARLREAVKTALAREGFTHVSWTRYRDGRRFDVRVRITLQPQSTIRSPARRTGAAGSGGQGTISRH